MCGATKRIKRHSDSACRSTWLLRRRYKICKRVTSIRFPHIILETREARSGSELESKCCQSSADSRTSYSYTDAKYRSYLVPNAPPIRRPQLRHTIPFTPRNAANFRAETRFGLRARQDSHRPTSPIAAPFSSMTPTVRRISSSPGRDHATNMQDLSSNDDSSEVTVWRRTSRTSGDHQQRDLSNSSTPSRNTGRAMCRSTTGTIRNRESA